MNKLFKAFKRWCDRSISRYQLAQEVRGHKNVCLDNMKFPGIWLTDDEMRTMIAHLHSIEYEGRELCRKALTTHPALRAHTIELENAVRAYDNLPAAAELRELVLRQKITEFVKARNKAS